MRFRHLGRGLAPGILVLAIILAAAVELRAGDNAFQVNFADSFFAADPPCPLKEFPTLETIMPIPPIVDPFEQDLIPVFCQVDVSKRENPVKGARGKYNSQLVVLDNTSGTFEMFSLGSGKFKTNSDGLANFELEIPAMIFADGFESGDVSAWTYTRVDLKRKKKASGAGASCHVAGTK